MFSHPEPPRYTPQASADTQDLTIETGQEHKQNRCRAGAANGGATDGETVKDAETDGGISESDYEKGSIGQIGSTTVHNHTLASLFGHDTTQPCRHAPSTITAFPNGTFLFTPFSCPSWVCTILL